MSLEKVLSLLEETKLIQTAKPFLEDYRKGDSPQITLKEAKEFFGNQAANISSRYDVSIKPFIMDTAMR